MTHLYALLEGLGILMAIGFLIYVLGTLTEKYPNFMLIAGVTLAILGISYCMGRMIQTL